MRGAGPRGRPSVERFFQFSLLGLVASGYLAVAGSGYLDTPTIALTAAGLVLRGLLICGLVRLDLSDRTVTLITLGYTGFFALDYFLLSREFLTATVHLVFFLAVMKILTAKTNRDYLYTAAIAFVELLAAALLSIDFNFFLFLALYLLFAMAALTSGEIRRSTRQAAATARSGLKRFYPRLALHSALVTLGILSIAAGLFFLLPRTAEAAFSRLISHRFYLPGFSSEVTLGEFGEIKTASRPVMHIRIFSSETPGGLKWRGRALAEFDGKRWSEPGRANQTVPVENGHADLEPSACRRPGRHINYHVDLDAFGTDALFFAGVPEMVDLRYSFLLRTATGSYRLGYQSPRGVHYDAYSRLEDPPETSPAPYPAPILPLRARSDYLQLPPLDPRIPELARAMTAGAATDLERARAIERRLRADYGYTLELPDHEVADPLAYFLFTRKKGHCEYFASAMTVMLRTAGIPARLATGFQSGVYNPITDFWLVRASDAHAWVEAWIPGHGWTTFDPTPPDPNRRGFALLTKLGLYLDAAEHLLAGVGGELRHQPAGHAGRPLGTGCAQHGHPLVRFPFRTGLELASPRGGVVPALWRRHPDCAGAGSRHLGAGAAAGPPAAHPQPRGARPPRPGHGGGRHPALRAHARPVETPRLPEARVVHARGVRRIAAAGPTGDSRDGVHRPVQRSAFWPPHGSGAAPVDASR